MIKLVHKHKIYSWKILVLCVVFKCQYNFWSYSRKAYFWPVTIIICTNFGAFITKWTIYASIDWTFILNRCVLVNNQYYNVFPLLTCIFILFPQTKTRVVTWSAFKSLVLLPWEKMFAIFYNWLKHRNKFQCWVRCLHSVTKMCE